MAYFYSRIPIDKQIALIESEIERRKDETSMSHSIWECCEKSSLRELKRNRDKIFEYQRNKKTDGF
jgi:hypothetical protein